MIRSIRYWFIKKIAAGEGIILNMHFEDNFSISNNGRRAFVANNVIDLSSAVKTDEYMSLQAP